MDEEKRTDELKEELETEEETKQEPEKKYTDADVDEIVKKKIAKLNAKKEQELKDAKAEAEKLASMNAEQKAQYEIEKLQKENENLKAEAAKAELSKEAANQLGEAGITSTPEILSLVVAGDAETTKAKIDTLIEIISEAVKKAELKNATGKTPKSYGSDADKKVTKEDFIRMSYQEVMEFKAKDPEGYKKLTEK